jgi:excisionase family DNA binding protein
MIMDRILHPRRDAADLLAISLRKLDLLVKQKLIRIVKIGRRTLVPHAELEKFAKRGTGTKSRRGGRDGE